MRKMLLPLLLTGTILSGCAMEQAPSSYQSYGVSKGAGSIGVHTVLAGDTVYSISKNYNLPMREIITFNNIQAPYRLNTGFRVKLPPPNEHKVSAGDSIFSVSKLYEVSSNRLVELNNLKPPYKLQAGQVLRLPTPTIKQEAVVRENMARQERASPTQQTARLGRVDRETLDNPTRNNPIRDNSASNNDVTDNEEIKTSSVSSNDLPQPTAHQNVETAVVTPGRKPSVGGKAKVQKASTATRAKIPTDTPKLSGQGKYMRPVSGRVVSSYGPKADGLHNDGINIKAARGTPVRAAENGVVVYAGDDLAGYGNLILVRHQGKIMTAYAHLDKMLVKRGAKIERGQSIGTVGSTGQVDTPQLHFEVRKGSTPVNPDRYL